MGNKYHFGLFEPDGYPCYGKANIRSKHCYSVLSNHQTKCVWSAIYFVGGVEFRKTQALNFEVRRKKLLVQHLKFYISAKDPNPDPLTRSSKRVDH